MTKKTGINVVLLCEVAATINDLPNMFEINAWHLAIEFPGAPEGVYACACIAGWAIVIHDSASINDWEGEAVHRRARELLRLDEGQADRLFYFGLWPLEMQTGYCQLPAMPSEYENNARLAGERIQMFIETNGER